MRCGVSGGWTWCGRAVVTSEVSTLSRGAHEVTCERCLLARPKVGGAGGYGTEGRTMSELTIGTLVRRRGVGPGHDALGVVVPSNGGEGPRSPSRVVVVRFGSGEPWLGPADAVEVREAFPAVAPSGTRVRASSGSVQWREPEWATLEGEVIDGALWGFVLVLWSNGVITTERWGHDGFYDVERVLPKEPVTLPEAEAKAPPAVGAGGKTTGKLTMGSLVRRGGLQGVVVPHADGWGELDGMVRVRFGDAPGSVARGFHKEELEVRELFPETVPVGARVRLSDYVRRYKEEGWVAVRVEGTVTERVGDDEVVVSWDGGATASRFMWNWKGLYELERVLPKGTDAREKPTAQEPNAGGEEETMSKITMGSLVWRGARLIREGWAADEVGVVVPAENGRADLGGMVNVRFADTAFRECLYHVDDLEVLEAFPKIPPLRTLVRLSNYARSTSPRASTKRHALEGKVIEQHALMGDVTVRWSNGDITDERWGQDGVYDLERVLPDGGKRPLDAQDASGGTGEQATAGLKEALEQTVAEGSCEQDQEGKGTIHAALRDADAAMTKDAELELAVAATASSFANAQTELRRVAEELAEGERRARELEDALTQQRAEVLDLTRNHDERRAQLKVLLDNLRWALNALGHHRGMVEAGIHARAASKE